MAAQVAVASDVLVVGSGLPALAVSLALARRRARVTLLHPRGGAERVLGLGLALLGTSRPYDRAARELGRDAARALWESGRENLAMLGAFVRESRHDCGVESRGSFLLAIDREEAASLAESEDMLRDDGFPGEFLDHYMLESRFDLHGFAGAYWAADGAEVDPAAIGRALHEAVREAGVSLVSGLPRTLVEEGGGVIAEIPERGTIRSASGVLATDGAAFGLLPAADAILRPAAATRLRCRLQRGATLPTAARTVDGHAAWWVTPRGCTMAATGPAGPGDDFRLRAVVSRLPLGSREELPDETGEIALDGLPVVGVLPGRPLAVARGLGAFPASLAFSAADWIAEALVFGRDKTPAPLRPRSAPAVPAV